MHSFISRRISSGSRVHVPHFMPSVFLSAMNDLIHYCVICKPPTVAALSTGGNALCAGRYFTDNFRSHPCASFVLANPQVLHPPNRELNQVFQLPYNPNNAIYVYDDPAVDWSRLVGCYVEKHGVSPWRHEEEEHAQNMAEVWVHQALLRHPMRTRDPAEASLFYIPLYVTVSSDATPQLGNLVCENETHYERVDRALDFLETESKHFMKFGGANHFFVCSWWRCGVALGNRARVVLSRTILGINESPPANDEWARWECTNRVVTIPYVSSTKIPASLFTRDDEYVMRNRSIPFYFAGRMRDRPERANLAVITDIYPASLIGVSAWDWKDNPNVYGENLSSSQFCLCPRGDTMSSRRLFDAVAAGCIPVLSRSQTGLGNLPFISSMDYAEFAFVLPDDSFAQTSSVAKFTNAIMGLDTTEILRKRRALLKARGGLIYGYSTGDSFEEMEFFQGTIDKLIADVSTLTKVGTLWECTPSSWWLFPADRVDVPLPPSGKNAAEWVSGTETLVVREHETLVCTPPFTGSKPVREFVWNVQRASTWEIKNFVGGLDILRVQSGDMFEMYATVGWKKMSMVRDPVTRLFEAYRRTKKASSQSDFKTLVHLLNSTDAANIPREFRPQSMFCGTRHVHFDSVLLYEESSHTEEVLRSLPNNLWTKHGHSWAAAQGDLSRRANDGQMGMGMDDVEAPRTIQCGEWVDFYDAGILDMVASIYHEDYRLYKWYNVDVWKARLEQCST